jgi:hypothetical protein
LATESAAKFASSSSTASRTTFCNSARSSKVEEIRRAGSPGS